MVLLAALKSPRKVEEVGMVMEETYDTEGVTIKDCVGVATDEVGVVTGVTTGDEMGVTMGDELTSDHAQ